MQIHWSENTNLFTRPYWRYMQNKHLKPGVELDLEDFRKLYLLVRLTQRQELRRERLLRFLYLPVKILAYLVDLTQLRDLENLRLRYARFFNYYLFRQYLDFQNKAEPPAIIRLLEMEVIGKIAIAKLYHQTTRKDNVRAYIKKVLKNNFQIPAGQVNITRIDSHHLKLVFPIHNH